MGKRNILFKEFLNDSSYMNILIGTIELKIVTQSVKKELVAKIKKLADF